MNDKLNYIDDVLHDGTDTKAMHYLTDIEEYISKLQQENLQLKKDLKMQKDGNKLLYTEIMHNANSQQIILEQQLKQRDDVIDEAIKYIKDKNKIDIYLDGVPCNDLLEILQKYKGDKN